MNKYILFLFLMGTTSCSERKPDNPGEDTSNNADISIIADDLKELQSAKLELYKGSGDVYNPDEFYGESIKVFTKKEKKDLLFMLLSSENYNRDVPDLKITPKYKLSFTRKNSKMCILFGEEGYFIYHSSFGNHQRYHLRYGSPLHNYFTQIYIKPGSNGND